LRAGLRCKNNNLAGNYDMEMDTPDFNENRMDTNPTASCWIDSGDGGSMPAVARLALQGSRWQK